MTTTLQVKLRGIFLADDLPENLTNTAGDIFSNVVSAVSNFFQYLIGLFNQEFPPEDRDEQIHRWFHGATPYLIAAGVLITCLCCWICLFPCISFIIVGCFNIVWSFLVGCFNIVRWFIVGCFNIVRWFIFGCFNIVRWFFRCICCCARSTEKMMKAPGRPLQIPRAAFEANPLEYFRGLRGLPNNFRC